MRANIEKLSVSNENVHAFNEYVHSSNEKGRASIENCVCLLKSDCMPVERAYCIPDCNT